MQLSDLMNGGQQPITVTAGAAITANDLVSNHESGAVYSANAALGISVENNATEGPSAVKALATVENSVNYGCTENGNSRKMAALGNGNIATVYSGDGTTDSINVNVRIRSPLGADVVARVTVSTDTGVYSCRVVALSATQFVVSWGNGSNALKFAVFDNDGTVAVAATTVATLYANSVHTWNIGVLASGQFVLAYDKVTSRDYAFSRYNASGVLQGTETVVEAAAQGGYGAVLGCVNGDFVVMYYRAAATAAYKFARYNSSGVIVGSLTSITTAGSGFSCGDSSNGLIELSGGNIAIATTAAADTYPDVRVYNSTNTLLNTVDLGSAGIANYEVPQLIPLDSGGFALIARNASTQSVLCTFDSTGKGVAGPITIGSAGVGSTGHSYGSGITAFSLGAAGYAVLHVGYDGTNYDVRLFCCSSAGVAKGSEIVLRASGTGIIFTQAAVMSGGVLHLSYKDAGTPYLGYAVYNVYRRSVLGVALGAAAEGESFSVGTRGQYAVNQAFTFGGNVDNRTAAVPGIRGTIVGSTATLWGME